MLLSTVLPRLAGTVIRQEYYILIQNKNIYIKTTLKTVSCLHTLYNIPYYAILLCMTLVIVVNQSFNLTKDHWLG